MKERVELFGDFYTIKDMLENELFDVPQSNTEYNYMIVNTDLNYHHKKSCLN